MRVAAAAVVACLCAACGSEDSGPFGPATGGTGGTPGTGGEGGTTTTTSTSTTTDTGGTGGTPIVCPDVALEPGEHQRTIAFDGNDREYELQIPASYDNSVAIPLVFDIHGYSGDKEAQQAMSGWQAQAEMHGFAVVRPNGTGLFRSWNGGDGCCGTAQSSNLDDVGLMKAIAAEVQTFACIDPRRIHASGHSNGAALTHRLGCEAADVFAALVPVSYPLDFNPFTKCVPSRPIAIMHFHGTSDGVVWYGGGPLTSAPVVDSFAYWAQANSCPTDPTVSYTQGQSRCDTYAGCDSGVATSLCTLQNGGHLLYANPDDVPIAELAWAFFTEHPLP